MYKIIHNLVDLKFTDFFNFSNFNGHCLRRHNLHLERKTPSKTQVRSNFYSIRVVKIWNGLPAETVNSQSLSIFKKNLECLEFNLWNFACQCVCFSFVFVVNHNSLYLCMGRFFTFGSCYRCVLFFQNHLFLSFTCCKCKRFFRYLPSCMNK